MPKVSYIFRKKEEYKIYSSFSYGRFASKEAIKYTAFLKNKRTSWFFYHSW
jgi:hypothetical protein